MYVNQIKKNIIKEISKHLVLLNALLFVLWQISAEYNISFNTYFFIYQILTLFDKLPIPSSNHMKNSF